MRHKPPVGRLLPSGTGIPSMTFLAGKSVPFIEGHRVAISTGRPPTSCEPQDQEDRQKKTFFHGRSHDIINFVMGFTLFGEEKSPSFGPLSVEEYLRFEEQAETKHEYVDGYVYAMAGVTKRHNLLTVKLSHFLWPLSEKRGCLLFVTDVKLHVRIGRKHFFYYPDLVVTCDPEDRDPLFVERPCLIVEVTSPSTARIDRFEKFFIYVQIESLKEYLILSQDRLEAVIFRRSREWEEEIFTRPEDRIRLECLEADFTLGDLYQGLPED